MSEIPEGFLKNNRGDLVRIENVKEIHLLQDQVATDLAKDAQAIFMALAKFKRQALDDIRDLIKIAGEKHDVKLGGEKGNITIPSYDGRYKIQRAFADRITFGIEIEAAKDLFLNYLNDVADNLDGDARVLVESAFKTTRNNQLRTSELLRLLSYDIKHPDWVKACEALRESMVVDGQTVYIRVYERINDSDKYRPIPLNITDVAGGYER